MGLAKTGTSSYLIYYLFYLFSLYIQLDDLENPVLHRIIKNLQTQHKQAYHQAVQFESVAISKPM